MSPVAGELERLVDEAAPKVFWTDRGGAPEIAPALRSVQSADLCVIGGGFTGLWSALLAAEADPARDIVVVEAGDVGHGASTRNGGFCEASLTHGFENGLRHWPTDFDALQAMGRENLDGLLATLEHHEIDVHAEPTGQLVFATQEWQVEDLEASVRLGRAHGENLEFLDADAARAEVHSPTYLAGAYDADGAVMVDPALLTWGLRRACETLGVRFFEHSRVRRVAEVGRRLQVETEHGSIRTTKVIVATNAWAEPVREMRRYVVPIYDHVLMTEPLTAEQMDAIGWNGRQGLADAGNQFHYYRLTSDDRILWGGYDANYYRGNGLGPEYEQRRSSHVLLARHFFETFPQLEGLRFSHRWAGPIGTTSKFAAAFGTKFGGNLAWAAGYTGLGVGASRFGASVALDLVDGVPSERTELLMVKRKPMPFPPEPLRNVVIQFTRRRIAAADANGGEPGLWLRTLDRFGVGFDS